MKVRVHWKTTTLQGSLCVDDVPMAIAMYFSSSIDSSFFRTAEHTLLNAVLRCVTRGKEGIRGHGIWKHMLAKNSQDRDRIFKPLHFRSRYVCTSLTNPLWSVTGQDLNQYEW
jgi:hypothetical protein